MIRQETGLLPYHIALNGPSWPGYPKYPDLTGHLPPLEARQSNHITGLFSYVTPVNTDERGFFSQTFTKSQIDRIVGQQINFVQANHSYNLQENTFRGIHIAPWYKVCRVASGSALAIIIDTRRHSPTFGEIDVIHLLPQEDTVNGRVIRSIIVPPGLGNSYLTLEPSTDYLYLVSDEYRAGKSFTAPPEIGVACDDPYVHKQLIKMGLKLPSETFVLSPKDKSNKKLAEIFPDIQLFSSE